MSRQVKMTLPDAIHADLVALARHQGRAPADLAKFFVEFALEEIKRRGEFPANSTP
ncbi:MAG: hypothetical protein HC857_17210, partial [Synechococcales cyanobacterium RU_4_20]|nr:hypothetical protein [Synechococcales cyanobacterium RU_4_20]